MRVRRGAASAQSHDHGAVAVEAAFGIGAIASFLLIGNAILARNLANSVPVNYWGAIAMPILLALAPAAFALVPGVRASSLGATALVERLRQPTTSLM